jgi:hypothetical protein
MAVNTLVTGLIVFRILKVYFEIKPTLVERTLGSTGGIKFRPIIFILIESGMAMFAIQLVRVVIVILPVQLTQPAFSGLNLVIGINQMFNVIIRSVHFYLLMTYYFIILATRASHQQLFWCGHQ